MATTPDTIPSPAHVPLLKTFVIALGCGLMAFTATAIRNRTAGPLTGDAARARLSAPQAGLLAATGALLGVLVAQWWGA